MLHIREGKGRKDRYVPLGEHLSRGLQSYIRAERPYVWLFNGKTNTGILQQFSETGVQWVIKEAAKKSGIKKHVTSHVLRHTYATHLLEMGLDIMTLKDLLGHADIQTTLVYLHVAQLGRDRAFNPLDRLYKQDR
jgi:integrase/recombinase XerD